MQPEIYSSGFLLFRWQEQLQFLLMKHPKRWDLPKGHLDAGETKQQAALRELHEEADVPAKNVWIDPEFVFENQYWVSYKRTEGKKQLKELTIYIGFLLQDQPIVPTEHEGYAWFNWSPPHQIQSETIDPLLKQTQKYFAETGTWPPIQVKYTQRGN